MGVAAARNDRSWLPSPSEPPPGGVDVAAVGAAEGFGAEDAGAGGSAAHGEGGTALQGLEGGVVVGGEHGGAADDLDADHLVLAHHEVGLVVGAVVAGDADAGADRDTRDGAEVRAAAEGRGDDQPVADDFVGHTLAVEGDAEAHRRAQIRVAHHHVIDRTQDGAIRARLEHHQHGLGKPPRREPAEHLGIRVPRALPAARIGADAELRNAGKTALGADERAIAANAHDHIGALLAKHQPRRMHGGNESLIRLAGKEDAHGHRTTFLPAFGAAPSRHNGPMSAPGPSAAPHLTGRLRTVPGDFRVDECPLYELSGEGEHVFVRVEKTGLTTAAMVERVARALGANPRDAGVAGMKDRHAVTTQWLSLTRTAPEAALALDLPGIRVLEATRHGNKLRTGHLAGNRFDILVRGADTEVLPRVQEELGHIERTGLPNFHGPQRYGVRGDNAALGRALAFGDAAAALALLSAALPERETPRVCEARAALAARDAERALDLFPREFGIERHFAQCWRRGFDDARALATAPDAAATFLMNAWQSSLFDAVLAARLEEAPSLIAGDVAMKLANGACFVVEDLAAETVRAETLEIMPTGPLPGAKMLRPTGAARAIEDRVLAANGCDPDALTSLPLPGARRALRVLVRDASAVADPDGIRFRFQLPAGAFATALLAHFGVHERRDP